MRWISFLLLLFFLAMFAVGQKVYVSQGDDYDIYNMTNKIKWNSSQYKVKEYTNTTADRLPNIINKMIDFVGYTGFEVAKWGVEYGYEHPEIDYYQILIYLKYLLYIWLIAIIIPIVLPMCAIIYLLFVGMKRLYKWLMKKFGG